jgi:hypothetical protein
MGRAYSAHRVMRKAYESLKGRCHSDDLDVDERMILRKQDWNVWIGLVIRNRRATS